jgi:hypothetical protein
MNAIMRSSEMNAKTKKRVMTILLVVLGMIVFTFVFPQIVRQLVGPKWGDPTVVATMADVPEIGPDFQSLSDGEVRYVHGRFYHDHRYYVWGHATPEEVTAFAAERDLEIRKRRSPRVVEDVPPGLRPEDLREGMQAEWWAHGGSIWDAKGYMSDFQYSPTTGEFFINFTMSYGDD